MIIETHAHLYSPEFENDIDAVIERANESGIGVIITVSSDIQSSIANRAISSRHNIYFAPGIHPHDTENNTDEDFAKIEELIKDEKAVAVGETGLDFFKNYAPQESQEHSFVKQIDIAKRAGKPLIVHCRNSYERSIEILEAEDARAAGGVVHCFSGDYKAARQILDMGFYIGVGGTITYPNSSPLREIIKKVPLESVLLETDCPYLPPQPYRGKRNEPSFLVHVVKAIAELRGLSEEDIERMTSLNAETLFSLGVISPSASIAYKIRNSLYLNVTNKCSNHCVFCARGTRPLVKGHLLRLEKEPSAGEMLSAIGEYSQYDEIVFCGYGEPLIRLDFVKEVAGALKKKNVKIRINTNGQANIIHGRNILPELKGLVDRISISLNAQNAELYHKICRSDFGKMSYDEIIRFAAEAKKYIPDVTLTVVDFNDIDVGECRAIAESIGVGFRIREYNEVG
ncbi:MAG: YchF/TatD family DNA exonuclease [Candidatus Schekmanbacteria bacterium]|nr:YchF/TatD family DNA exonuclease [Candidatus Schekmanbacteria bacterium]